MKVYRTKEGTIFEIVCAALLVIAWAIVGYYCLGRQAGLTSGIELRTLMVAVLGSLAVVVTLVAAYKPEQLINMPIRLKTSRQYEVAIWLVRIVAVEEALILIAAIPLAAHPTERAPFDSIVYCLVAVLVATVLVGTFLAYRRK